MNKNNITFEQPVNELTRVLLRLEHLFNKINHFQQVQSSWHSRAALNALFDSLDVLERNDFRAKLNKEISRQCIFLESLVSTPNIDLNHLNKIIDELTELKHSIRDNNGRFGQALRENAFLNSVRQHHSCAGGTSPFNTPGFYLWLQSDFEQQSKQIAKWFSEFETLARLTNILLKLTRESTYPTQQEAIKGFFQMPLETHLSCQLVRITVPVSTQVFPRISAGRHGLSIRFLEANLSEAAHQTGRTIKFQLTCCVI